MHITTNLGELAIHQSGSQHNPPLIFMHGVFLDHTLWDVYIPMLQDKFHIINIDMPAHGDSQNIKPGWTLPDCVNAIHQVTTYLRLNQPTLIGHSWGAMTALRLIHQRPDHYTQAILFNMPILPAQGFTRLGFYAQLLFTPFRSFYATQAAKALYSPAHLTHHPEHITQLIHTMSQIPPHQIRQTIRSIIINPDNATDIVLKAPSNVHFCTGVEDYVTKQYPQPPHLLPGGHISPHEAYTQVTQIFKSL